MYRIAECNALYTTESILKTSYISGRKAVFIALNYPASKDGFNASSPLLSLIFFISGRNTFRYILGVVYNHKKVARDKTSHLPLHPQPPSALKLCTARESAVHKKISSLGPARSDTAIFSYPFFGYKGYSNNRQLQCARPMIGSLHRTQRI